MRFPMPVGPFNESIGEDCFMTEQRLVAMSVLCWMFAVYFAAFTLVLIADTLNKTTPLLRILKLLMAATITSASLLCLGSVYAPGIVRYAWTFMTSLLAIDTTLAAWILTQAQLSRTFTSFFSFLGTSPPTIKHVPRGGVGWEGTFVWGCSTISFFFMVNQFV
jgi:hypothetical protein